MNEFVIIVGSSGSGKTSSLKFFENRGYSVSYNYPLQYLGDIQIKDNFAITLEILNKDNLESLQNALIMLENRGVKYSIIYLDTSDEVLLSRYELLRSNHPLNDPQGLLESIRKEKEILLSIKNYANNVIDTSKLRVKDLYKLLEKEYILFNKILFISFGFKHGIPQDADFVFDVRMLQNPFYEPELRHLTGNDKPVYDYVMGFEDSKVMYKKIKEMLEYVLENYLSEVKPVVKIAIGCTGGEHRSVSFVNRLYKDFSCKYPKQVFKIHRELI